MAGFFQRLFLILAHPTEEGLTAALLRQLEFAQVQNEILRSKLPKRITVTPRERQRLIKYGKPLGTAIKELITIVTPRTFARWQAAERDPRNPRNFRGRGRGRPRTDESIRDLILRMAHENDWGYTRILGELRKLGIHRIGRTTIQNLLKEHGLDPGPQRRRGTWDEFLRRHAQTLWACDFVSVRTWTWRGPVDCFLLFFIHVDSRRVWCSPATAHPTGAWVAQQARNFCMHLAETKQTITHLLRDRDGKFTDQFDAIIKTSGTSGGSGGTVRRLPVRSPNLNAFAERWVQSLRVECLDHFVILGERHLDHLVSEYIDYYHRHRPHQGNDNDTLDPAPRPIAIQEGDRVLCEERLGGLLKHYHRQAA